MRELNKKCVYDLSVLTSEEYKTLHKWLLENDENWDYATIEDFKRNTKGFNLYYKGYLTWHWINKEECKVTHNAKELFYTLENIQVDCSNETEERIKKMADVFENEGYKYYNDDESYALKVMFEGKYLYLEDDNEILLDQKDENKTTITYEKFMEFFGKTELEEINEFFETNEEAKKVVEKFPTHYDNTNGSIYKFCNDQKLNSWEFDVIKRVVRCRKKGLFKEDLQKTKDLIDLYLKEHNE